MSTYTIDELQQSISKESERLTLLTIKSCKPETGKIFTLVKLKGIIIKTFTTLTLSYDTINEHVICNIHQKEISNVYTNEYKTSHCIPRLN